MAGGLAERPPAPPGVDAQGLEDLACAYWQSEVLFAALELDLFTHLEAEPLPTARLAQAVRCQTGPLSRLLLALASLGLVREETDGWRNLPAASRHLVAGNDQFLGDFLLYRRYLQPSWQGLASAVAGRPLAPGLSRQDDYPIRTYHYVRALDQLARHKAGEIAARLAEMAWSGPVLDIGGGAGSLGRALRRGEALTLFDLPEVLAAAHRLSPRAENWEGVRCLGGDFRDFPFADGERFGLILMANFLHTYHAADSQRLIAKAAGLLPPRGLLLIHDYFPDRTPVKGQLYDLNMLLNTAQGSCHPTQDLADWLEEAGLIVLPPLDLASDSGLLLAQRPA